MIEQVVPFLIAAGIGLMIGIERERHEATKERMAMGVRTFILIGVMGALAQSLAAPLLAVALAVFVFGIILVSYYWATRLSAHPDLGITTELSAGITFVAGYLASTQTLLSAFVGIVTLVVLVSRRPLHRFSRQQVRPEEIQAAVILLVMALGIWPFLPAQPIDPFGLLSLQKFGSIVIVLASIQFLSYVAMRIWGAALGLPIAGLLSGLVSSTAVFLTLPGQVKANPGLLYSAIASALLAAASTLVLSLIILVQVSFTSFRLLSAPIGAALVISAVGGYWAQRRADVADNIHVPKNPLSLLGVLRLSLFLGTILMGIGLIQRFVGSTGTQIAAFLTGLFELHGVTIASASLMEAGKLPYWVAERSIMLAIVGSMVSKIIITWALNRGRYAVWTSGVVGMSLVALVLLFEMMLRISS